ncbi:hypothetical protein [Methanocorpusculum sp.]
MNRNNLRHLLLTACIVFTLIISGTGAVSAETQSTFVITDFPMYPASLMSGDSGIVTVTIKNTGTTFVPVNQIFIKDAEGIKSSVTRIRTRSAALEPAIRSPYPCRSPRQAKPVPFTRSSMWTSAAPMEII